MTVLLIAVVLVLFGIIAISFGAIAGADPEGRGGRLMARCFAGGVLAICAGVALMTWWWRTP